MSERTPGTNGDRGAAALAGRVLSRGRFLALLAGGAVAGWAAVKALGSLTGGWRINTVENPRPEFDATAYRLTIDGLVEQPLTLTYGELLALPAVRQVSDFHCVEGWGVDDVQWDGVSLQTIANLVRPSSGAGFVTFHSLGEIYRDSLTLEQALLPDVLVAYRMNGIELPPDHGPPARLIMPRMYGYKGPKWLTRIEFRDRRDIGYWEERGWRVDAWIEA
ncbi:MAG: molybdopterin-dependent oxidoreductase [Chloroflexi bacterium]|nr:molybdopterin-dependent oxidoreductase [Chloroflexota bacterium]